MSAVVLDTPRAATSGCLELHGKQVSYRQTGHGPTVLLVHGLGATQGVWDDTVAAMRDTCTVVTVDLPGHGGSSAPAGDYSLGANASVLRDVLDALGHPTATIVGHSLGGGVAMQFGYQFPERVDRLVLVASGGLGPEISPWLRAATLPGADVVIRLLSIPPVAWARRLACGADADVSIDDAGSRQTFLRSLRAVADHRGQRAAATDRLYLLDRFPTLVLWGRRDAVIPVAHAELAHAAMPNSRLVVFDDAGHCPHLEEPQRFTAELADFLAVPATRAAP